MIYLKDFKQGKVLYEALDSEVRLGIIEELMVHKELNLAYFAKRFDVSNGAITAHVKKLQAAGLITVSTSSGVRGTQKICSLAEDKIVVDLLPRCEEGDAAAALDVGQYVSYEAKPACGLATRERVVGRCDDATCFSYPERFQAGIVWMESGYVEYEIPNFLTAVKQLEELQLSVEISSITPGDIVFFINGKRVGSCQSEGGRCDRTGAVSPAWWTNCLGQYGKKAVIAVNAQGAFINGVKVSEADLCEFGIVPEEKIRFRIAALQGERCGGLIVFGKSFGDYGEGIVCRYIFQ